MLRQFISEPLLHFLVAGTLLFVFHGLVFQHRDTNNANRILVDREGLLGYLQYRTKLYDFDKSNSLLDSLSSDKKSTLIDDYVREEALFREAKAFNLDKNDYSARQRLIQQLTFINEGFISSSIELTLEDIQQYLDSHNKRYFIPAKITFNHVFFSNRNIKKAICQS